MSRQYISEKAQERIFNVILKRPDNQVCADCATKGPRWVSMDFGVFICMDCAGAHRTLGPSVTRVRSTNIDGWYQENVDLMESLGNATANSYWENQMPPGYWYAFFPASKPTINAGLDALIRFVQEKYVKKRFIPLQQCDDPKAFYLKSLKTVQPYYFQITQKEVETPKVHLGDLIDMDGNDDDFNFPQPENFSKASQHGTNTAHSLSPAKREEVQVQPPVQSLPSLDIMNLYKSQSHGPQGVHTQNNIKPQGNYAGYAYLSNLNRSIPQQPQQPQQPLHPQQPQQPHPSQKAQMQMPFMMGNPICPPQPQYNMMQPNQTKPQGPINILELYGQK